MARDYLGNVWLDVHAREHATAADLAKLGSALEAWHAQTSGATVHGLAELLRGEYPPPVEGLTLRSDPEGSFHVEGRGRFSIPTPWRHCYARVMTHERVMSEAELLRSLREAVPSDVGEVTPADSGHW